ncbi:Protein FAM50-like protein [Acromyrmex echinatior]|uniref:Protein FAM50 homolog n=1 Tax=Acromyrmex echinatior TaxID=103372 RepID=F4WPT8_ACREC|nr:Protein FAM50-like protein [Acromyrmex echinatior]
MAHYKGAASEAGRAMQLMKKREIAQQEIELRKKKIEDDLKIHNIENKFATHYNAVEQQLKTSTIGLVTLNEMKAKQENIVKERERKLAQKEREKEQEKERALAAKQAEKNKQKRQIQALSFNLDEDEDENEDEAEAEAETETETETEVSDKNNAEKSIKSDDTRCNSIYQLLQRCLEVLRREFSELKTVMADQLMYVKEDLILPHHYTFYDFIVTKARHDASVETEESHAGKVLLRSWYERNKHIFPASRWEPFDPTKSYDKYTVSDKNRKKDKIC